VLEAPRTRSEWPSLTSKSKRQPPNSTSFLSAWWNSSTTSAIASAFTFEPTSIPSRNDRRAPRATTRSTNTRPDELDASIEGFDGSGGSPGLVRVLAAPDILAQQLIDDVDAVEMDRR